jgi:hypothetical protein
VVQNALLLLTPNCGENVTIELRPSYRGNAVASPGRVLALRQYVLETYNRRVLQAQNGAAAEQPTHHCLCACGISACRSILGVSTDDYRYVLESPHRMPVAPGHARPMNVVIRSHVEYDIVEIARGVRLQNPPTSIEVLEDRHAFAAVEAGPDVESDSDLACIAEAGAEAVAKAACAPDEPASSAPGAGRAGPPIGGWSRDAAIVGEAKRSGKPSGIASGAEAVTNERGRSTGAHVTRA